MISRTYKALRYLKKLNDIKDLGGALLVSPTPTNILNIIAPTFAYMYGDEGKGMIPVPFTPIPIHHRTG